MTPIYHDNVVEFQHIAPGRAQRGGGVPKTRKSKPTKTPKKYVQVAAPDFLTQRGEKGQLELPKIGPEWGTKSPQSQSKDDTTDNIKNKAVSRAK